MHWRMANCRRITKKEHKERHSQAKHSKKNKDSHIYKRTLDFLGCGSVLGGKNVLRWNGDVDGVGRGAGSRSGLM